MFDVLPLRPVIFLATAWVALLAGGLAPPVVLAQPTNPTSLGSWPGFNRGLAVAVAVSSNYAYVAASETGLQVIDVSDPTRPRQVSRYATSASARGVAVSRHPFDFPFLKAAKPNSFR